MEFNLTLPGRKEGEKFARMVPGILSETECKEWIDSISPHEFTKASKSSIRTNYRQITVNKDRADLIFRRIRDFLPKTITLNDETFTKETWDLYGCNAQLSFLRYEKGQYFTKHVDIPYIESDTRQSMITCQIYLNQDFEGGETRFDQEVNLIPKQEKQVLDVVPETGSALLFEHELSHEGRPVIRGIKFSVRVNVLYEKRRYA